MNAQAHEALLRAVRIKDHRDREQEVEAWVARWVLTAEAGVNTSDPHPKVVAMELAAATREFIERVCLDGPAQRTFDIRGSGTEYVMRLTCIRYEPAVPLAVVPATKKRRKK